MLKQIGLALTWFIFPAGFFGYLMLLTYSGIVANRLIPTEQNFLISTAGLVGAIVISILLFVGIRQHLRKF
jgi:hypothetical protein